MQFNPESFLLPAKLVICNRDIPYQTLCMQCILTLFYILCFVDRASPYICVIKTNFMHYLSSAYFVNQFPYVSSIYVAHHQELYCIYTTIGTCCSFQLTVCWPGPTDSQLKSITRTNCCIYTIYLLTMGYKYARNI